MGEPKSYIGQESQGRTERAVVFGTNDESNNAAIENYISGDGMWINDYLRKSSDEARAQYGEMTDEDKAYLKALDKATASSLPEQILWRSVDASAIMPGITDMEYENLVSNLVYGDNQGLIARSAQSALNRAKNEILEKGFMSTTKSESTASEWGGFTGSEKPIVLKMSIPKGTKGVDLSKHRMAQDEVLLKRGQRYRVNRIYGHNGNIVVDAQIIK